MATRVMIKSNGEPDMRYASNRRIFAKDPTRNLDGSADIRLKDNKDKIATKAEVKRAKLPNVKDDYFELISN